MSCNSPWYRRRKKSNRRRRPAPLVWLIYTVLIYLRSSDRQIPAVVIAPYLLWPGKGIYRHNWWPEERPLRNTLVPRIPWSQDDSQLSPGFIMKNLRTHLEHPGREDIPHGRLNVVSLNLIEDLLCWRWQTSLLQFQESWENSFIR